MAKNPPASAGDVRDAGPVSGSGGPPGGGHGSPPQCSCLQSPTDRGACGLRSTGSQSIRHDRSDLAHTHGKVGTTASSPEVPALTPASCSWPPGALSTYHPYRAEGLCTSGFPSWPVSALKVTLPSLCLVLSLAQGPAPSSSQWMRHSDASLALQTSTGSRMAAHSVKNPLGHRPLYAPRAVTPAPGFPRRAGLDCKAEAGCDLITENLT